MATGPLKRTHLSLREIEHLIDSVSGRCVARDRCLILLSFRHGLRVGEVCALRVRDVDLTYRALRIRDRQKPRSDDRIHPLHTDEVEALQVWLTKRTAMAPMTDNLFISEQRTPISRKTVWRMLHDQGQRAGLGMSLSPALLRVSCRALMQEQGRPLTEIEQYFGRGLDDPEGDW